MKQYKEHIYSLEDRHEGDISPLWQILQVLFFTCCVVFGYSVCFTFGHALSTTQFYCILNSKLSFNPDSKDSSGRPNSINALQSEFSSIHCDLVIYMPMVVSTFACFCAVMFAYCGRGGAGSQSMPEAWRIIMPTLFFNLLGLCLIAYTANLFQQGLKQFLQSIADVWDESIVNLDDITPLRLGDVPIGNDLITYLTLTKHAIRLLVSFWGLNFLWILLRLLFNVDFQLVRTTIHVYPKTPALLRSVGGYLGHASFSETSLDSRDSQRPPSVRFRTVQFTPSTAGPKPLSEVRRKSVHTSSSQEVNEPEEIEIAEVDYNQK